MERSYLCGHERRASRTCIPIHREQGGAISPPVGAVAGEVHNLKNASSSASAKALAFYVAKKGARLEDLAVPAK
jgi:hypothetical protein